MKHIVVSLALASAFLVAAARFPVRILLSDADRQSHQLPAGAGGAATIYTDHVPSMQIIRRVVLRWYTWLNYIKFSM